MKCFQKLVSECLSVALVGVLLLPFVSSAQAFSSSFSYEDEVRVNEFEGEVVVNSGHFFPDTDASSLEGKAAAYLHALGIIGGFPDGEFKGDRPVTRAELAKFLVLGAKNTSSSTSVAGQKWFSSDKFLSGDKFLDIIKGEWYWEYVVKAADYSIMEGYPDGRLRPEKTVNTAEFLKMISHTFNIRRNMLYHYNDTFNRHWFGQYAGAAEKYEMFPFREKRYLQPDREMTRKDVAIALFRYLRVRNEAGDDFPSKNNTEWRYLECIRTQDKDICQRLQEIEEKGNVSEHAKVFRIFDNDSAQQRISVVPGQENVEVLSFKFVAGNTEGKISSLKFRRIGNGVARDFETVQLYTNKSDLPISQEINIQDDIVTIPLLSPLHFSEREVKHIMMKSTISTEAAFGNDSRFVLYLPEWVEASEEVVGFFPFGGRDISIGEGGEPEEITPPLPPESAMNIKLSSQTPQQQNVTACTEDVVFTTFDMTAALNKDVRLDAITVTRMGDGNDNDFENVRIERNGTIMTDLKSFNNDDVVEFRFPSWFRIKSGTTETFDIVADLKCEGNNTNAGHRSSFVIQAEDQISSSAMFITGNFPIKGNEVEITGINQSTSDVPRISFWYGKVNQHNEDGVWKTDPTGMRGAGNQAQWGNEGWGDRPVEYCQLFWPETTSVSDFETETIDTWCTRGNQNCAYTSNKMSYECVQGEEMSNVLVSRDPSSPGNRNYSPGAHDEVALIARVQTEIDQPVLIDGVILRVDSDTKIFDENGNETNSISYLRDNFHNIRVYLNDNLIDDLELFKGESVDNAYAEFNSTFEINDIDQLKFMVDIKDEATNNSELKVSFSAQDFIDPEYLSTGNPVPEENLLGGAKGSFLEIQNSLLQINRSDGFQDGETIIAGESDISVLKFVLDNNDSGDVEVAMIFLEAEGMGNSLPYENFTGAIFMDGIQQGSSKNVNSNGSIDFEDLSFILSSARQEEITFVINTTEASADGTIQFSVTGVDANNIVSGLDITTFYGEEMLSGNNSVVGAEFQLMESGELSVQTGVIISGRDLMAEEEEVDILNINASAQYDDIDIKDLYFINDVNGDGLSDNTEVSALIEFSLYNEAGQLVLTKQMTEGMLHFDLANQDLIHVSQNGSTSMTIKGDVRELQGGQEGVQLRLVLYENETQTKGIEALSFTTGGDIPTPANGWGTAESEIFTIVSQ